MRSFRRLLIDHRLLSLWLIAAAIAAKLLVPVGYMPVHGGLALCSGAGIETMAMGGGAHRPGKPDGTEHGAMPCGFGGHAAPAMATVDPVLLALAILFIVTTVSRAAQVRSARRTTFLRPHPRGPPAVA